MTFLKKILPWLAVLIGIALLYDGYIFYSRGDAQRKEKSIQSEKEQKSREFTVKAIGGGSLKILNFYAAPAHMPKGGKTRLCYGVAEAKTVKLDPPADDGVWPSLSRCVGVSPANSTSYTLTADDGAGHTATEQAEVIVQ